ncbi:regulator of chromosome condensation (RCC1) family protein [Reticulomyxa filosa]|uniref:Regulator of chromosome condensation (RCC1) family protein n=1 Tax=Reticulomyxa filosa TaxID=46433 RepID=X6MZW8_RETFI|nr:regulator of chromosome condensation (RCC1) family protein [Reticulomyxa filosa]|eukprot:ETO19024.1 regulator of chromosome condensation (RCC1) family protein [Reticulomyxa filosa]
MGMFAVDTKQTNHKIQFRQDETNLTEKDDLLFDNFDSDFGKSPTSTSKMTEYIHAGENKTKIVTKTQNHNFCLFYHIYNQKKKDEKAEKKGEGHTSDSEGSAMSDGERRRIQTMFARENTNTSNISTPTLLSPPSRVHSTKSTIERPRQRDTTTKVVTKSRKSEPVNTPLSDVIPERKIGVNPSKEGTNTRVRSEIQQTDGTKKGVVVSQTPTEEYIYPKKNDCLPELRRGTPFLKFGKQGFPHFRQFNISQKHDELIWFSTKKKLEQKIVIGQETKEFRRISWTTLAPASFTIWYSNNTSSLNLVAKSVDEMRMWIEALRILQEKARNGEDLSKLRSLEVSIDFKDRNRPKSRRHRYFFYIYCRSSQCSFFHLVFHCFIVDASLIINSTILQMIDSGNFVRSHETKDIDIDESVHRRLIGDLKGLTKLFQEVKELAKNEVIQKSNEGTSINQILSELEERMEELKHEVLNTRNTKIAENDVWRTRVDLRTLKEKISVLVKENKKTKRRFTKRLIFFYFNCLYLFVIAFLGIYLVHVNGYFFILIRDLGI